MLNLIQNENMKIYHQLSTYIMLGLMIVVVIAGGFISTNGGPGQQQVTANTDWRTKLTEENTNLQASLQQSQGIGAEQSSAQIEKLIKTNNYRLEHNLPPEYGVWGFVTEFSALVELVSLFVIIIAAGIVAGEFNTGTIKLLLIRPIKRWKVLLSKYIAVFLFAIVALILLFVVTFVVGGIFHSFNGFNQPYLRYRNGNVTEVNMLWHIFINYAYACVNLLMMVTFAFMISAVFRNNTLAVGISLFLMFTGTLLVGLLSKYSWVKYILFANINLTVYTDGTPVVKGMTITFSLMVLAVYFIVFNLISWFVFMKRDVAT